MNFYLVCFKIRQILLCKIQNEPTLLPALSHLCWKDELGFHNPVLRHSDQGLKVKIVSYFFYFFYTEPRYKSEGPSYIPRFDYSLSHNI